MVIIRTSTDERIGMVVVVVIVIVVVIIVVVVAVVVVVVVARKRIWKSIIDYSLTHETWRYAATNLPSPVAENNHQ